MPPENSGSGTYGSRPGPVSDLDPTVVGRDPLDGGQTLHLGSYRARDGATGAPIALDCEHPHAITVVGKRGSGKSHTLGVLAEGLTAATDVTPIIIDPMGEFNALATALNGTNPHPRIRADALPPRAWCGLLDLDPTSPTGALIWRAATHTTTLDAMHAFVADATTDRPTRHAATNHLDLAANWNVFSPTAPSTTELLQNGPVVLDCSPLPAPAANAICHAIAADLYDLHTTHATPNPAPREPTDTATSTEPTLSTLPWLLVDEAHVFYNGTAHDALETLLTRGRTPGISLVTATQRPSALPTLVHSQSDLTLTHRLTNGHDRTTLSDAHPTHAITNNLPSQTGDALIIDDATTTTHHATIRHRTTPDNGTTPTASETSNTHLTHRDH